MIQFEKFQNTETNKWAKCIMAPSQRCCSGVFWAHDCCFTLNFPSAAHRKSTAQCRAFQVVSETLLLDTVRFSSSGERNHRPNGAARGRCNGNRRKHVGAACRYTSLGFKHSIGSDVEKQSDQIYQLASRAEHPRNRGSSGTRTTKNEVQ